jgi:hypothetical protein
MEGLAEERLISAVGSIANARRRSTSHAAM